MKQILLVFFTLYFLNQDNKKVYLINRVDNQKDSFYYYYKILDSANKRNRYDTSILIQNGVRFMEKFTGLNAHPDGDYIGWYCFTNKDLITWKKWYKDHAMK